MKKLISIRNALLPISAMVLFFTAVCTGIGILAFGSLFSTRYANDIAVFSPDSRYTLIIRPRYDWDGAGADFYCRATGNPAESLIGGVSWQDHYHPFRDGQYRIHWEENSVAVFYAGYSASDVSSAWKSVKFSLPNQENAGFPSPQNTHFFLDFFHVLC